MHGRKEMVLFGVPQSNPYEARRVETQVLEPTGSRGQITYLVRQSFIAMAIMRTLEASPPPSCCQSSDNARVVRSVRRCPEKRQMRICLEKRRSQVASATLNPQRSAALKGTR